MAALGLGLGSQGIDAAHRRPHRFGLEAFYLGGFNGTVEANQRLLVAFFSHQSFTFGQIGPGLL